MDLRASQQSAKKHASKAGDKIRAGLIFEDILNSSPCDVNSPEISDLT
jgi:hypothetical protein